MHEADRPAALDDDQSAVIFELSWISSAVATSASGAIVRGERVMISSTGKRAEIRPQIAAQIAVRDDAGETAVRIDDDRRSRSPWSSISAMAPSMQRPDARRSAAGRPRA